MSPFREAPQLELGPLDVGLEPAAQRAEARLPRGGRLVTAPPMHGTAPLHHRSAVGALGSTGLALVVMIALTAWVMGWRPASMDALGAALPVIGLGGVSLAVVLRAADRTGLTRVRRAETVAREARAVLRRLVRIEAHARRGRVDASRAAALRRALAAAADPAIALWIPADVRGRAELLLARMIVATTPGRGGHPKVLREVRALLLRAAASLDDAAPACADLAAVARAPETAAPVDTCSRSTSGRDAPARPRRIAPVAEDPGDEADAAARSAGFHARRW